MREDILALCRAMGAGEEQDSPAPPPDRRSPARSWSICCAGA